MWGINLWLDWPPLARGSKFHTIHTPTKAASLPPLEQWKIWTSRFRHNNINYSSRQFRFPVWYFKGIYRTILSEHIIRRHEAGKETWHNKFVVDAANNNFKHVGTLKYINLFYYTFLTGQIYHTWIVHEHKCLSSFLFFRFSSNWERERGGYIKLGIRRNGLKVYLSFLFFFDGVPVDNISSFTG